MIYLIRPDDTLRERLAKLRAQWIYKREMGIVCRDVMTPIARALWTSRFLPKAQRAKLWLIGLPRRSSNVIRFPKVRA